MFPLLGEPDLKPPEKLRLGLIMKQLCLKQWYKYIENLLQLIFYFS